MQSNRLIVGGDYNDLRSRKERRFSELSFSRDMRLLFLFPVTGRQPEAQPHSKTNFIPLTFCLPSHLQQHYLDAQRSTMDSLLMMFVTLFVLLHDRSVVLYSQAFH